MMVSIFSLRVDKGQGVRKITNEFLRKNYKLSYLSEFFETQGSTQMNSQLSKYLREFRMFHFPVPSCTS